jgi:hypothetical protein
VNATRECWICKGRFGEDMPSVDDSYRISCTMPEEYVWALEAVAAMKDPDPARGEKNRRLLSRLG